MHSEDHTCMWCKSPTKKVSFTWSETDFKMVCNKCDVNYKFKKGRFSGFSVRREYNGEDYVYRLTGRWIGRLPRSIFLLSKCNKQAKSPLDYYEDICEIDIYSFSPDKALENIPRYLNNK